MSDANETCWTLIRRAAQGAAPERDALARRYRPAVESYLRARWRGSALREEVDDGCQETLIELLREGGAVERVDAGRGGGFRAFLYGIARNVALRIESRAARRAAIASEARPPDMLVDDPRLSIAFDRAWAQALVREAAERMAARAAGDSAALRRVELLRLRFAEGRPIREIALLWETEPLDVHRQYARARDEFREVLREVVAFEHPGDEAAARADWETLLGVLE